MHYTYVLVSDRDHRFYTGTTNDLRRRLREHGDGRVASTAYRRPVRLVYYEACVSMDHAYPRERFLKTGKGKRYLKNRLASSLFEMRTNQLERH